MRIGAALLIGLTAALDLLNGAYKTGLENLKTTLEAKSR